MVDQRELVTLLKHMAPYSWPSIWAAVRQHRSDCLRTLEESVADLLADRTLTRKQVGLEVSEVVSSLEEEGSWGAGGSLE